MKTGVGKTFHILRKIAEGGFGAVYLIKLVHPDGFSRLAALKLLHRKWSKNEEVASRMRDEARLLGWLRHRNIVDVMDLTRLDGRVAVVMEYLEAVDCGTIIKHCYSENRQVPVRSVLEMGAFVASALDAAYNQAPYSGEKPLRVIHRDIKPSNIMVDVHGAVKVLDFGVARADFEAREAATQEMSFGSFDYMSSERVFMEDAVPRSDVYALAATCFEMITVERFGRVRIQKEQHEAFVSERLKAMAEMIDLDEAVMSQLVQLLEEMLAFEIEDRPEPVDVYRRMRALSREIPNGGLEDWAEDTLPPVVEQFQSRTDDGSDPLVGQVLREDPIETAEEIVVGSLSDSEPAPDTMWVHQTHDSDTPDVEKTDPTAIPIPSKPDHQASSKPPGKPSKWPPILMFLLGMVVLGLGIVSIVVAIVMPEATP